MSWVRLPIIIALKNVYAGSAGPSSSIDPATYWPRVCSQNTDCWAGQFRKIEGWEESDVKYLQCDLEKGLVEIA